MKQQVIGLLYMQSAFFCSQYRVIEFGISISRIGLVSCLFRYDTIALRAIVD